MTRAASERLARAAPSPAILAQAADWYACLRDGRASARDRAAWQHWLQAADEHRRAWQAVESISQGFEPLTELPDARHTAARIDAADRRLRARRRTLLSVGLLAGTAVLGGLAWRDRWPGAGLADSWRAWTADHRTGVGEHQTLTLADGSRLWLNTASAVDLDFSRRGRLVQLRGGEIFVATVRDPLRPFEVSTRHGRMRALGTRFNVRLAAATTQLTVFEGAVEIHPYGADAALVVPAGQGATFTADGIGLASPADPAREAWTEGRLVADRIPLAAVVGELRRHHRGVISLAGDVGDLTVYGSFPLHDTDRVLSMLASALPIRVHRPLPGWVRIDAGPGTDRR